MLEETKGDSPKLQSYTRFDTTETIEEEACEKYYVRWSAAPAGFEDPNEIIAQAAFNGSATSEYYPGLKAGSINPGAKVLAGEQMSMLWSYMLLNRRQPYERPDEPMIRSYFSDKSRVRPKLEQVSGQWCHVVDTTTGKKSKPYATVWLAADKNGLPMKFERHSPRYTKRVIVTKVNSVETDTGKIWYPEQATKDFNDIDGYRLYRFHVQFLRANIETTPDTFKVSFPPGTDVIDTVAGIYYTTGAFDEKKRFGVLEDLKQKSEEYTPPEKKVSPATQESLISTTANKPPDTSDAGKELAVTSSKTNLDQPRVNTPLVKTVLTVTVILAACITALLVYRKCTVEQKKYPNSGFF
jgi:hypothetical protein